MKNKYQIWENKVKNIGNIKKTKKRKIFANFNPLTSWKNSKKLKNVISGSKMQKKSYLL